MSIPTSRLHRVLRLASDWYPAYLVAVAALSAAPAQIIPALPLWIKPGW